MVLRNMKRLFVILILLFAGVFIATNVTNVFADTVLGQFSFVDSPKQNEIWVIYNDVNGTSGVTVTSEKIMAEDSDGKFYDVNNNLMYDYTDNKVVLPRNGEVVAKYDSSGKFISNEAITFTKASADGYDRILSGYKLTAVLKNGTVLTEFIKPENANYANPDDANKDINTVYAQAGWYVVPNGVTAIVLEPVYALAIYVRSPYKYMYYDEYHIFAYGKDENGNLSIDYYEDVFNTSNVDPNTVTLAVEQSSDDNSGQKKVNTDGSNDGPLATLYGAYQVYRKLVSNRIIGSTRTMYDVAFVLCDDLYDIMAVTDAATHVFKRQLTKTNHKPTYKEYIYMTGNSNGTSMSNKFGFEDSTSYPVTITSDMTGNNLKKYSLFISAPSYDISNMSSLRIDNVHITGLNVAKTRDMVLVNKYTHTKTESVKNPSGTSVNISVAMTGGTKDSIGITKYSTSRQFNLGNQKTVFETSETATSDTIVQIRLAKAASIKLLGGKWNPVANYSVSRELSDDEPHTSSTLSPKGRYILIGGTTEISYLTTGSCNNNTGYESHIAYPATIIITGGCIPKSSSSSLRGIYGSGVIEGSNVGEVNIFMSDGSIDAIYGAGYGSVGYDYIYETFDNSGNKTSEVNYKSSKCDVNIEVYGGTIGNIYGAGQFYTSKVHGDVNLSFSNAKITGNVYGGGKGGNVLGNVNLDINNCEILGTVFGGGLGLTDSFTKVNDYTSDVESTNSFEYAVQKYNETVGKPGENFSFLWDEAPSGFPRYDRETGEVYTRLYHSAALTQGRYYLYEYQIKGTLTLAIINGDVLVNINNSKISKDVYGGGSISAIEGSISLNIKNSDIKGTIYGGGDGVSDTGTITLFQPLDAETYKGPRYVNATVNDKTQSLGAFKWSNDEDILDVFNGIYYCKNNVVWLFDALSGYPTKIKVADLSSEQKVVYDKYGNASYVYSSLTARLGEVGGDITLNIDNVSLTGSNKVIFGGGNKGIVKGSTSVTFSNTEVDNIYAGGNEASVNNTSLTILSGSATNVFGGGNKGAVLGNIEVVAGGIDNLVIENLYAASNQADVVGNVNLTINNGNYDYVFGGNNLSGDIGGNIQININAGNISALYGGGNKALFNHSTTINFNDGTIIKNDSSTDNAIFGGGKEAYAKESIVNIYNGMINSSIYGGGYVGDVDSSSVNIYGGTIEKDIYGGGLNGDVRITNVLITENNSIIPIVDGTVYGGGQDGMVTNQTKVDIAGGVFAGDIYGGGKGQTATTLKTSVDILGATISGTVYGGGNLGVVTSNINVNITDSQIGTIFGGGNEAEVEGKTCVTINGSTILNNQLFGGGNLANVIDTEIMINDGTFNSQVYGGGNKGLVENDAKVTINNGNFKENVYGGGYQGNITNQVTFDIFGGSFAKSIYGGGYAGTAKEVVMNLTDYDTNGNVTPILINDSIFAGGEGLTATVLSTDLTIDFKISTKVKEELESDDANNSGQAKISFDLDNDIITSSKILGSVYGGGDLAKVGDGVINMSKNEATINAMGNTNVVIINAYVADSVFAGGRGVAPEGMSYNVYMGTVFGYTEVTVNSGYIGGSIYGGGRESRVYAKDDMASVVNLEQTNVSTDGSFNNYNLIIGNSVFGGGDRGTGEATNASVPTTIGDVEVNIEGCSSGTAIYFIGGGVYGDGNLCLVNGDRVVNMKNFTTGINGKLKTFYSLQRAAVVNLDNTDIVLLGAIDKVEEGDDTKYSINRVTTLNLENGSTVKLSTIVKYLSTLYSSYDDGANFNPDRVYVNQGNNGSNNYQPDLNNDIPNPDFLTEDEIISYRNQYEAYLSNTTNNPQNTISVANGLFLELKNLDGTYGRVVGLFTLQLFVPTPGEGGGLVYADIPTSIGDFICVTKFADDGNDETIENYMDVLDDVCRLTANGYTAYYWYIAGTRINYNIDLTGYIGSEQTSYTESVTIPRFPNNSVYMLNQITLGDGSKFEEALKNNSYQLVSDLNTLNGNRIAVEVCYGQTDQYGKKNTLGFLYFDLEKNKWGLHRGLDYYIYGYNNEEDSKTNLLHAMDKNIIYSTMGLEQDTGLDIILHKSPEVNVEYNNLSFSFQIDLFVYENEAYTPLQNTTNELFFACNMSIRRLVPVQSGYASTGHLYSGVSTNLALLPITSNSSFTMQIQTRYIPGAFPIGTGAMNWFIKAETYNYYFDSGTSSFLVTDINERVINHSDNFINCFDAITGQVLVSNAANLTKVGNNYTYTHYPDNETEETRTLVAVSYASYSPFPIGTTITLVDITEDEYISIYYYIVNEEDTVAINLLDFMQMGSNIPIKELADKPYFMDLYADTSKANVRITENLIFIFDFTDVKEGNFNWNSQSSGSATFDEFSGKLSLAHIYQGKDIMDYVKTPETENDVATKEYPRYSDFIVSSKESGIEKIESNFDEEEYCSNDEYILDIEIKADDYWHNTEFQERDYAVKIELINSSNEVVLLPEGMSFIYDNTGYYSKDGGKSVIIPFGSAGTYQISISNYMFGLYEHLESKNYDLKDGSSYKPTFRITTYSAVDGGYFNDLKVTTEPVTASFKVNPNQVDSLKVVVLDRVVKTNEDITFEVKSSLATEITFEVFMKVDGQYGLNVTNKFMPMGNNYSVSNNGQSNEIKITVSNEIETGTYQFIARNGKYREIITIIVVKESSANSN